MGKETRCPDRIRSPAFSRDSMVDDMSFAVGVVVADVAVVDDDSSVGEVC